MHIEGSYEFEASQQLVWDMLQDTEVLSSVIPGSKGLEEVEPNKYHTALKVKVGPVNGKFEANIELADVHEPDDYKLLIEGSGPAGHVTGEGVIQLEHADGVTIMKYAGDAQIGGKIAAVGQRLIDVAAKQITKQSLRKLAKAIDTKIEEQAEGSET
jgi:carbon monoxide dehydrogenase subunit G